MVDYTWVINLLRETDAFASDNNLSDLSQNLALACAALISDTKDKVEISPDARQWLQGVVHRQIALSGRSEENTVNLLHC